MNAVVLNQDVRSVVTCCGAVLPLAADCNENTTTMEISKPKARMPTTATSCKVLCTYACAGGLF